MNTDNCLTRADALINGPRRTDYGPIEKSAVDVARMWSALLGIEITPDKYLLCMAAMKLYRQTVRHKIDNLDDACGYIALAEQVIKNDEAKQPVPRPAGICSQGHPRRWIDNIVYCDICGTGRFNPNTP